MKRRLLIVDDDDLVLRALSRALKMHYDVTVIASPEEALSLARSGARWDVVLSDLVMPGMNGIELAERLIETCSALSVRIVLMTGGTLSRAIDSALASCGLPTISKPFDLAVLLELLSKVNSGHS